MTYEILRFTHVLGVVIFMGNIIVTALWKISADKTRNPQVVAFSQELVSLTDWVFTLGGVALVLIGGYGMAWLSGIDHFATGWLLWGEILFTFSAIIWLAILVPLQIKMHREAKIFKSDGQIPEAYWRKNRLWYIWGIVATSVPLGTLFLMVVKP